MAGDIIKLDYPKAEEMRKTFKAGSQQIENTLKEMKAIANKLKEGALLGDGGKEFVEAIQTQLAPSLVKLKAKYDEMDKDVAEAVKLMKASDKESAGNFSR
jgi:WXG100 family type VII secretion target